MSLAVNCFAVAVGLATGRVSGLQKFNLIPKCIPLEIFGRLSLRLAVIPERVSWLNRN